MNKKYILPVILMLTFGVILMLLPERPSIDEIGPEELLAEITNDSRFLGTDDVADRMIRKDPSMILIDARASGAYQQYALPGAVNIPLNEVMKQDWQDYLSQEGFDFVFYSNDDVLADQAWILCRRKGLEHIYIMRGGMNQWFSDFFMNAPPPETAAASEYELYMFRQGVKQYFTGSAVDSPVQSSPEPVIVTPRAKKSKAEGGC